MKPESCPGLWCDPMSSQSDATRAVDANRVTKSVPNAVAKA